MPEIPCPGGLATNWSSKKAALKWAKKVNAWPCGPSNCADRDSCYRGGVIAKVKLVRGGYAWNAQVWCLCPQPLVSGEGGAPEVMVWAPVRPKPKRRPTRGARRR